MSEDRSTSLDSIEMIGVAQKLGAELVWDRYAAQLPQCGFGETGLCCRHCLQGRSVVASGLPVCLYGFALSGMLRDPQGASRSLHSRRYERLGDVNPCREEHDSVEWQAVIVPNAQCVKSSSIDVEGRRC